jgi:hypothetical protein
MVSTFIISDGMWHAIEPIMNRQSFLFVTYSPFQLISSFDFFDTSIYYVSR